MTRLDVSFGVQRALGGDYDSKRLSLKVCVASVLRLVVSQLADARSIVTALSTANSLSTLVMQSCSIDDDLLRILTIGLITVNDHHLQTYTCSVVCQNNSITRLDLSHNQITNHGVRLISKLLREHSVLASLALGDNSIQTEV